MRKITFAFLFLTFALVAGVVFAQATRNVCSQVYEENKETIQAYDSNGNGKIEKEELDKAVNDWLYQVGKVSDSQLLGLVKFSYLGCTGPVSPSPSPVPSPTPVATLKVISPNGGEKWEAGKTYDIKWSQTGLEGQKIGIYLDRYCLTPGLKCSVKNIEKCAAPERKLIAEVEAEQGTYSWTIPQELGEKRCLCFVLIKQDENVFDRSDRWFSILPPDIPAKGTLSVATNTVGVNQPISVTIKAEDPNGLARVCLYRAGWECRPCSIELPTCTQTFVFTESREGTYKYYGYLYGRTADGKIEPGTWTDPQSVEIQVTGAPPPPSSPSPSPTTSAEVAPRGTISVSPAVALSVRNQEITVQIRGEDPNGVRELRLSVSPSVVSAPDHQCGGATSCASEWKFNATSFRGLGMVKFCGQVVGLKTNGTDTEVVSTFPACVYVIVL